MLYPTDFRRKFDYREFGHMFFDWSIDLLEIQNNIHERKHKEQINLMSSCYNQFQLTSPDIDFQHVKKLFGRRKQEKSFQQY